MSKITSERSLSRCLEQAAGDPGFVPLWSALGGFAFWDAAKATRETGTHEALQGRREDKLAILMYGFFADVCLFSGDSDLFGPQVVSEMFRGCLSSRSHDGEWWHGKDAG